MKVKATRKGFYGNCIREEGDKFTLEVVKYKKDGKDMKMSTEDQFSPSWMERLSKPGPKPKEQGTPAVGVPEAAAEQ